MSENIEEFPVEIITVNDETREEHQKESQALVLSAAVMEQYGPGFVIIASPNVTKTPEGYLFPDDIAVTINSEEGFTPSVVAAVLRQMVNELEASIDSDLNMLKEEPNE
jgi:hypothetical protein